MDEPLAYDKIMVIRDWLDSVETELEHERISYGELAQIDHVFDSVKVWVDDEDEIKQPLSVPHKRGKVLA